VCRTCRYLIEPDAWSRVGVPDPRSDAPTPALRTPPAPIEARHARRSAPVPSSSLRLRCVRYMRRWLLRATSDVASGVGRSAW
jgi:hypothetical protein